jgi:hypothetical protein
MSKLLQFSVSPMWLSIPPVIIIGHPPGVTEINVAIKLVGVGNRRSN